MQTFVSGKLNSALISPCLAFVIAAMGFRASDVTEQGKDGVWFTFTIFALLDVLAIPTVDESVYVER